MTTEESRIYKEDDEVDEFLLNKLSYWILYDYLPSLGRDLGIPQAELSKVLAAPHSPTEQCFQVNVRCKLRGRQVSHQR